MKDTITFYTGDYFHIVLELQDFYKKIYMNFQFFRRIFPFHKVYIKLDISGTSVVIHNDEESVQQ